VDPEATLLVKEKPSGQRLGELEARFRGGRTDDPSSDGYGLATR